MNRKVHVKFGWLYLLVYCFRLTEIISDNPIEMGYYAHRIYFLKVGITPKEKELLEKGL